jgi:bifunctional DNase/RNase
MNEGTGVRDHTAELLADEVEVQIRGLMLDPVTNMPIVVLKDVASDLVLPIWVGVFEANAIALELEKTATPRPMTHDLLRNLARGLNAVVDKVVVSDLRDDTFYATIWMTQGHEAVTIDARPSDAIALALRWDCPIFVAKSVLGRTRTTTADEVAPGANMDADKLREWLVSLNEDETGGYKM